MGSFRIYYPNQESILQRSTYAANATKSKFSQTYSNRFYVHFMLMHPYFRRKECQDNINRIKATNIPFMAD